MATTILVKFIIPVDRRQDSGSFVRFLKWYPTRKDEVLVRRGESEVRLWIDRECVGLPGLAVADNEDFSRWMTIPVNKVFVEVSILIEDDLAQFIYDEREERFIYREDGLRELPDRLKPGDAGYDESFKQYNGFIKQYENLGHKVLQLALATYNRFIAFARNTKGQYWLHEHSYNPINLANDNHDFEAQVTWGNHDWFMWRPWDIIMAELRMPDKERAIRREDWNSIQTFVAGNRNPYIVHELLANSELLLAEGRRRSAVIEAVSALEVALSDYAKSPDTSLISPELRERIDVENLHRQVNHLGLQGTVRYLLPLLFSSNQFPTKILRECQQAYDVRNTVVHRGRRDVETGSARRFVSSLRKACELLQHYSKPPKQSR